MNTDINTTIQPAETVKKPLFAVPLLRLHRLSDGLAWLRAQWYFRRAAKLGSRVRLWGRPVIYNGGQLIIGNHVQFRSVTSRLEIVTGPNGLLEIGDRCYINHGCILGATKQISIGAHSHIGPQVMMMDNDFHRLEPERRHEMPESQPIILEENVWIGARAIILPGVTIGKGSVIGSGSIVTKDIPSRTVAVGSPARVIRDL